MFYYLYEIKNNITGKIYVGVHKTNNIDDGYMGSGTIINRATKKYGIENFTKTILEWFEDSTNMYLREAEVINSEFLLRKDVYNIKLGGKGGFDYINKNNLGWGENNKRRVEQSERMAYRHTSSENKEVWNLIRQKRWNKPEAKEKHSRQIKENWKNIEWAAKDIAKKKEVGNRPEIREMRRKNSLEMWQRPEYQKKHKAAMAKVTSNPTWLENNRQNGIKNWKDQTKRENMMKNRPAMTVAQREEQAKRTTEINKKSWSDPASREKRIEAIRAGQLAYWAKKRNG